MRAICALRVGAVAASTAAILGPAGAQAAETASQSFASTGEHPFVVPAGVTSLQVSLVGGNGGAGKGGAPGGIPATVTGTLAVSPGETLYAEVAGDGQTVGSGFENAGGYDGGASGGVSSGLGGAGGGGGGGASDLRTCSAGACSGATSLTSRLIVAAGGGGGGGAGISPPSTAGGNGGASDQSGSAGQKDGHAEVGGSGGQRGTSAAGGEAGSPTPACDLKTGEFCARGGQLGVGGVGGGGAFGGGAGGGGGGIFGGGGGGAGAFGEPKPGEPANGGGGGGGGGSSGVPAGVAGVSGFSLVPTATGAQPSVTIAWTMPPPAVMTGAASAVTSAGAVLNGTVNPDGSQVSDCHFVIAPAPPAGGSNPCVQQIGGGSTPVAVSASLAGLSPASTYTATLVASSAQGTSTGAPVAFATSAALAATSGASAGTGAGRPTISALKLSPSRFRRGKRAATLARAKAKGAPTATTISFALSQAATVTLTFEAAQPGVLARGTCKAPSKTHGKGHACVRYVAAPGAVRRAAHAGTDRIRFEGLLDGGKALAPGSYRLSLAAGSGGSTTPATQHPTFTLLK
jgi:hypothetical protein